MKIQNLVTTEQVHLDLAPVDCDDALQQVAQVMANEVGVPAETVAGGLIEREQLGSTAIAGGFAIPHCKLRGLDHIHISMFRFATPVPFGFAEAEPVVFVFGVLSPPDQPALHLQALSQIARILKSEEVRSRLLKALDVADVVKVIGEAAEGEGV